MLYSNFFAKCVPNGTSGDAHSGKVVVTLSKLKVVRRPRSLVRCSLVVTKTNDCTRETSQPLPPVSKKKNVQSGVEERKKLDTGSPCHEVYKATLTNLPRTASELIRRLRAFDSWSSGSSETFLCGAEGIACTRHLYPCLSPARRTRIPARQPKWFAEAIGQTPSIWPSLAAMLSRVAIACP
jgi:hypothetical protein